MPHHFGSMLKAPPHYSAATRAKAHQMFMRWHWPVSLSTIMGLWWKNPAENVISDGCTCTAISFHFVNKSANRALYYKFL
jgi:hypothetical protein